MAGITNLLSILNPGKWGKTETFTKDSIPLIPQPGNRITWIRNEFDRYVDYFAESRTREDSNWRMFSGYDYGQWDEEAVGKLQEEGRHVPQYNFIRNKIQGLAGSIVRNWFDIDFVPTNGKYDDLTLILKEMLYSDKEELDWNASYLQAVIDGLVFRGVEEMIISDRYNPLGNIGFERVLPGHILFDPNWVTNSGWDIRRAFKATYMTPEEIKQKYKTKSEMIDSRIQMMAMTGSTFDLGDDDHGYPQQQLNTLYGNKYRVIEYHHLEQETVTRELAVADGVEIPDGPEEYKRQWVIANQIDMSDGVIEIKRDVNTYYVTSTCPELEIAEMLEDSKSIIQIGRLPFFVWSAGRINGVDGGIVDLVADLQQTINKRESLIDHMITVNANGGHGVDPDMFDNDESQIQDYIKNSNNPAYRWKTAAGFTAGGRTGFVVPPRSPFPSDIINEINRMWDMGDRISGQPASADGRSESSHETGILFQRKQMQAEISNAYMAKGLEQYWNEKGEAYMLLAKDLYSGVYREFTLYGKIPNQDGKSQNEGTIAINVGVETQDGTKIVNDISTLPRHKVIVSMSPEGTSLRQAKLAINAELLQYTPPEFPGMKALIIQNILKSMDGVSEADRKEMEAVHALELTNAIEMIKTNTMNSKFQQMQISGNMQQMQNPQPPQQQQKPPSVSISFKDLPPEAQQAAMVEAGLISPQQQAQPGAGPQGADQQGMIAAMQQAAQQQGAQQAPTQG
jgi:hypothetical protein